MATASEIRGATQRRRRGKVLKLLQTVDPMSIADPQLLYRLLDDYGETMTIGQVHELLRDLKQRGYLTYDSRRTADSELPELKFIRLLPAGRDVIEGTAKDAAVDLI